MKIRASAAIVAALLAGGVASGCSSTGGGPFGGGIFSSDRRPMQSGGEPTAAEMRELCDLHRRMQGLTPEAQDAMLEAHMQSAHGSSNAQTMSMHRQTMLQRCSR